MKTLPLKDIIQINKGLNVLSNSGVGFKDVNLTFDLSLFKTESAKLVTAFKDSLETITGSDKEQEVEITKLLEKEYKLELPKIKLEAFLTSKIEIPMLAFDYLNKFITK